MDQGRRRLLCGLGGCMALGAAAGGILNGGAASAAEMPAGRFQQAGGDFGWKPHKLDPEESMRVAYDGYWHKAYACGYGAFYGIIGMMGEKFGAPYNQFPFTMLEANKGGISDWGTICGALYGAAAAFALFYGRKERDPMVSELFRWYEQTALPIFDPGDNTPGVKGPLPTNVSGSVICHISVSTWCYQNKIEATSKERNERCGRITADVCRKAVEILNAKIDAGQDWKGTLPMQAAVTGCGECHRTKGHEANWAKGRLDCAPCHNGSKALSDKFKNHP